MTRPNKVIEAIALELIRRAKSGAVKYTVQRELIPEMHAALERNGYKLHRLSPRGTRLHMYFDNSGKKSRGYNIIIVTL